MPMAWGRWMLGLIVRMVESALIRVHSYLLVDEALPLAGVPVGQVERVAGELDTTGALALGEVRVVAACGCKRSNQLMVPLAPMRCAYAPITTLVPHAPCPKHSDFPPASRLFTNISKHKFLPGGVYCKSWATYG